MLASLFRFISQKIEAQAVDLNPATLNIPAFRSVGDVISAALPMVVTAVGLVMFGYLVLGGIKYMTASGDVKQTQDAVKTITNAVVGLAIVFVSFWIVRIIETVFGLQITMF